MHRKIGARTGTWLSIFLDLRNRLLSVILRSSHAHHVTEKVFEGNASKHEIEINQLMKTMISHPMKCQILASRF